MGTALAESAEQDAIDAWANRFPRGTRGLWQGIRACARRLAESDAQDLPAATHAFLYAVGNFKRQSPIFPAGWDEEAADWEAPPSVDLWEGIALSRDDDQTWEQLTLIRGIGIPTATTVLAALWPKTHAVFDVMTVQAAVALRAAAGHWDGPVPAEAAASNAPPRFNRRTWLTWTTYRWYRDHCILPTATAVGTSAQDVERAWFELMRWSVRHLDVPSNESWADYGARLRQLLLDPPPS